MNFTLETIAALHTLMTDHSAQEMMIVATDDLDVWGYGPDDGLLFTAKVDELGGITFFEYLGSIE